jgi:hypothetical protein
MAATAATLLICLAAAPLQGQQPCPQAHAHNDYLHARPLLDALDNGFCSVEADIFLVKGELLVAHEPSELTPERSLKSLYLDPLRERIRNNQGRVYPGGPTFTLLIDIKSESSSTFDALHQLLSQYPDVFTRVEKGEVHEQAVQAIISGNRAVGRIASSSPRFAGIDGRLSDLDSDQPAHLLPLISDHWGRNFRWRGDGDMPADDLAKLKDIIRRAHDKQREIRFWAIPDQPAVWGALRDAGVDLINTDNLTGLSAFLTADRQQD